MKNFILKHKTFLLLYSLSFATIFITLSTFGFEANIDSVFSKINFVRNFGDTCLLTCLFWILPNRLHKLTLLPVAFVCIFSLINVWYFRFWNDILPVSCLTMTENVNSLLLNSIKGLLSWHDLAFILPVLLIGVTLAKQKRDSQEIGKRIKIYGLVASLICFLASQAALSEADRRWHINELSVRQSLVQCTEDRISAPPIHANVYYRNNGIVVHSCRMISIVFELQSMHKSLSIEQRNDIAQYIQNANSNYHSNIIAQNNDKNIIFIIAESLNADVINRKINNTEITPTLNRLISAEGTIFTTTMLSQIKEGGSGDGQMIYNSGILPLEVGATPLHLIHKTNLYPLSSQLKRNTVAAVFGGNATAWKERQNFENYGFARISSAQESTDDIPLVGHDAAMFKRGQELLHNAHEPFFIEFISESMHVPFNDKGVSGHNWIYDDTSLDPVEANYLRMCAYFDCQLSSFINFLKEEKLYDDTIIIIASDHSQNLAMAAGSRISDAEIPIVFIAANTGITKQITKPTGQIDVFPTILQIAGAENPVFAGVGSSMLDSIGIGNMKTAQEISELILRGNYFKLVSD